MLHAPPISFSIWSHEQYWVRGVQITKLLIM
jgi:hypothetical protein